MAVERRRQLPLGGTRGSAQTFPGHRGFVGGTNDPSTGLVQIGARQYDPSLGKFLSVDPILVAADPQQWNAYAYANNSPISSSDPTGLATWCIDDGACSYGNSGVRNARPATVQLPAPEKPKVQNQKLKNVIDKIYLQGDEKGWVGDGKTGTALRNEFLTGQKTNGSFHLQPTANYLGSLSKLLEKDRLARITLEDNPTDAKALGDLLTDGDRQVAINEAKEFYHSLNHTDLAGGVTQDAKDTGKDKIVKQTIKEVGARASSALFSDAEYGANPNNPRDPRPFRTKAPATAGYLKGLGLLSLAGTAASLYQGHWYYKGIQGSTCAVADMMGVCDMLGEQALRREFGEDHA